MNTKGKSSIKENKPHLMRWAGVSAIAAGLCFLIIGMFHPENVPSAVTTAAWVNAHIAATALGFFGLFGMAGLYVRQAKETGWLGLAGFILFTVWLTMVSGFSFVEAFILPRLATAASGTAALRSCWTTPGRSGPSWCKPSALFASRSRVGLSCNC